MENAEPSFEHQEVFPVIARIIEQEYEKEKGFVSHPVIVAALLKDGEGANLVEKAYRNQSGQQSREWWASNMVQWFSQQITIGNSQWERAFERQKVNKSWAYKPITSTEK